MSQTEENGNNWVLVTPKECFQCVDEENDCGKLKVISLRHPFSGEGAKFFYQENSGNVYEINSHKDKFGSWFVDHDIHQDGSLYTTNIFDPLFFLLPYLRNSGKDGKFMLLDQILKDEKYPECARLEKSLSKSQISNIAEISGSGDYIGYKYSQDKTLAWLTEKVRNTREAVKKSGIFIMAADEDDKENEDIHLEYAFGIISSYISEDTANILQKHLKIKKRAEKRHSMDHDNPSNSKKSKNDNSKSDIGKKQPKMSKAQRELSKVDKKGMKSISSFFSPAAKKR